MGSSIGASIAGSVISGIMNRNSAKRSSGAIDQMNAMNNRGFDLAEPYIRRLYEGGSEALDKQLETGAYKGPTYVGMNPIQQQLAQGLSDFGLNNMGFGQQFMDASSNFAQNYNDLYNKASAGGMNAARDYALSQSQPLIDAAMRDDRRRLQEQTLPGIDRAAAASRNSNSSRAGVADAVAQRAFDDRRADVATDVQDRLMSRSLNQFNTDLRNQQSLNDALKSTFGIGAQFMPAMSALASSGQQSLQADQQAQLNAGIGAFERERDFESNLYNQFGSGILGRAPMSPSGYALNAVDPNMATLMGGLQGFGIGGGLFNSLSNSFNQSTGPGSIGTALTRFNPASLGSAATGGMI